VTDELRPDIDTWAQAHGFTQSADQISGTTPLLRLGELGTTDDAYRGEIGGRAAWLAEFSIGSPNVTADFGGDGITSEAFTLFLVKIDASRWPRLTVHPSHYPDHDVIRRVMNVDHRIHTISPEMDTRYRTIAATAVPAAQLADLFAPELIAWWLAQDPEISVDIENHSKEGGYLTVAHRGLGIGDAALDQLLQQTEHLVGVFSPH
jgi:hypothetical protein